MEKKMETTIVYWGYIGVIELFKRKVLPGLCTGETA